MRCWPPRRGPGASPTGRRARRASTPGAATSCRRGRPPTTCGSATATRCSTWGSRRGRRAGRGGTRCARRWRRASPTTSRAAPRRRRCGRRWASRWRSRCGLTLWRHADGERYTWGDGEAALSRWLRTHMRVRWLRHSRPWEVSDMAFRNLTLPLNLQAQEPSPFQIELGQRKAMMQTLALPETRGAAGAAGGRIGAGTLTPGRATGGAATTDRGAGGRDPRLRPDRGADPAGAGHASGVDGAQRHRVEAAQGAALGAPPAGRPPVAAGGSRRASA